MFKRQCYQNVMFIQAKNNILLNKFNPKTKYEQKRRFHKTN